MFFTEVRPEKSVRPIKHGDKIWTIGSCFADEIGRRLADDLFDIRVNPCGTLYNPASVSRMLRRIIAGEHYTANDIFEHNGLWHCMDFHSSFSAYTPGETLARINSIVTTLHNELPRLSRLMITFGSARAFIDRQSGHAAGNCHKLPAARFETRDLPAEWIANDFTAVVNDLRKVNPGLSVIFTVSPIRHKAYGYHADKLSKAALLLAEDIICRATESEYFPSYEIMTDELRDYRFYAPDMIHPSATACDHIYMRFGEAFFTRDTAALAAECRKFTLRSRHRPVNRETVEYRQFEKATAEIKSRLLESHPELAAAIRCY